MLLLAGCAENADKETPALSGAPSSPEYAAAQAGDLPVGLHRCDYSGSIPQYVESMRALDVDPAAIDGTWKKLQDAGGVDSYIAVYTDTAEACRVWVVGSPDGPVHARSRVVSTVVVKFPDVATAEAAYAADIFQQSQLTSAAGRRVLSGPATKLGANSVTGATEDSDPTVHQAVWQAGTYNVFFTARNLTRAEFEKATSTENDRLR